MNKKISNVIGKIKLGAKRNAPELLLGGALITGIACVVTTGIATTKADEISTRLNDDKNDLCIKIENGELNKSGNTKELSVIYGRAAIGYTKKYAVPTLLFFATSGLVFSSYKIQKSRQLALSSALASATLAYSTLLNKIKVGADNGLTAKEVLDGIEVKQHVNEETGEVTLEKVQGEKLGTIYDFRFNKYYSKHWEPDKFMNQCTLNAEQSWANDKLELEGFLFLNDVLERLGLDKTTEGQIVGWLRDGKGDGFVDFGIVDCEDIEGPTCEHNAFDLSFNIDGDILSKFRTPNEI